MTVRFATDAVADLQSATYVKAPFAYTVTDCKSVTAGLFNIL